MWTGNYLVRIFCAVLIIVSFANPGSVHAGQTRRNISSEIGTLRGSVASGEVYLVPRDMTFRRDLTEDDVVRLGCAYAVRDREDLGSLVQLLVDAGLVELPARGADGGYDGRMVVRLNDTQSRLVSVVLEPDYSNAPPRGLYNQVTPVQATNGLEKSLRLWASRHKELARHSCSN